MSDQEFTLVQRKMLQQMLDWDVEYSYPYSEFDGIADKKILKQEMRGLIKRGYVELFRGGINDDGEMFGGTGFSITYERREEIKKLIGTTDIRGRIPTVLARKNLTEKEKVLIMDVIDYLDDLEIYQPEDLKHDSWRNWKYIRNSIREEFGII